MILKFFLDFYLTLVGSPIFNFFQLPHLPQELLDTFDAFCDQIFQNAGVVGFFIRPATLNILVPIIISLFAFEKIYYFVTWLLKKIPFIGIE